MTESWSIKRLLDWSTDYFLSHGIDSPNLTSQLLLADILGMRRLDLFLAFDRVLVRSELDRYKEYVRRRLRREPLDYIIASSEFLGLRFHVNDQVLIPRPETELLAELALKYLKSHPTATVVDIGTGSGVLAITAKTSFPGCTVWATDLSPGALVIAQQNAAEHGAEIRFEEGFFPRSLLAGFTDGLILSNPPYIRTADIQRLEPEVREYEPLLALDGGEDGLWVIRQIIGLVARLKPAPALMMEIGYDQRPAVENMLRENHLEPAEFIKDLEGIDRIVFVGAVA
ncbi:MAG: peptide chain release factor N(5)-glutamine methyltransferase [Candidatus Margulisiibacteriota bacterium]